MELTSDNAEQTPPSGDVGERAGSSESPEAPSPRETGKRVLFAGEFADLASQLEGMATRLGCRPVAVSEFGDLQAVCAAGEPEVVLLTLTLGRHDAIEVMRYLSERRSHAYVVLIGDGDFKVLESAERLGRSRRLNMLPSIEGPVSVNVLCELLRGLVDAHPDLSAAEFQDGMREGQFLPYFQPVMDLRTPGGRILRAEVLARWEHPFHGMLTAGEFIDAAERHSCIGELTRSLLREALVETRKCRESGDQIPISLNVSTLSLTDLDLPDMLAAIVAENGSSNEDITIELTESALTEERLETLDILTRLRMKGFGLSMDDFGTGYSTLLELVRLPFNEIKIDPRFIDQVGVRRESGIVIRTAIGLAHGLGMTVCAEGVEKSETLEFLRGAGCDAVQGRSILPPVPGDDLRDFLRSRRKNGSD